MGLHIFLYVPSDLVSNYGNCNLLVCFIKRKAFLWTTMELTKLEDNVPVPSDMVFSSYPTLKIKISYVARAVQNISVAKQPKPQFKTA